MRRIQKQLEFFRNGKNMAFKIIRNDITKVFADAIVNTANLKPVIGRGTDSAIYKAAGKKELLEARRKIGPIECGKSAWTDSFNLKENGIKYIIHTAGVPYADGKNGETEILRSCYSTSLNMAKELGCRSVAVPLLASGFYGFPKETAFQIAVDEISRFLMENEIDVTLVVYDRKSYLISEKLFDDVQSFIDENYEGDDASDVRHDDAVCADSVCTEMFSAEKKPERKKLFGRNRKSEKSSDLCMDFYAGEISSPVEECKYSRPVSGFGIAGSACFSNAAVLQDNVDAFILQSAGNLNFQNTLQRLIAERNLENSAVYTKAFIDRKFFSKIISNKNYVPKKMTVMALGLALELKLPEYESFLASAGYAFMPSSKFDVIIKYCVMNGIYNIVEIDMILDSHGENCFASE